MRWPSGADLAGVGTLLWIVAIPLTFHGPVWLWSTVMLTAWVLVPGGILADTLPEGRSKLWPIAACVPVAAVAVGIAYLTSRGRVSSTTQH